MHFIFFLYSFFSPLTSPGDRQLDSVAIHLPPGWTMLNEKGNLTIRCKDSVWVCEENTFNADAKLSADTTRSANGIPNNIDQGTCRRSIVYLCFRLEPKWSVQQWKISTHKNDSLQQLADSLPEKIGIRRSYLFGLYDSRSAPPDVSQKKARYFSEVAALQKQRVILPSYESEKYSLILVSSEGISDVSTLDVTIWPATVNRQLNFVMYDLLRKFCPPLNYVIR